jgi:LmbE family N-acetylglucosaminyl deacetylase
MKFVKDGAEMYVPDGMPEENALKRTTHLAIAAHQDDIEIMACHGILQCFGRSDQWFSGVVVTNGAGSPRDGLYAQYTDEEMQNIRKTEQKKSAYIGEYGAVILLNYPSSEVKDTANQPLINELKELIAVARPQVIYTHNLADKHDTHVSVAARVIRAIRELPEELRPRMLYGCEVWRDLDWVNDDEKVLFDVSAHPNIASAVLGVHDSQICGGKRYDLATEGRRLANATYSQSHSTDAAKAYTFAMDMTLLIRDDSMDVGQFILGYIDRFRDNVADKIKRLF